MTGTWHRPSIRELALLLGILALAVVLRLPGIDQRGAWDADQGHDMLVLQALARDGEIPLLGPKTSIGTFHHGAVYYYLLAPAALLSGADPVAVTTELALIGLGAVVGSWWLGRLIGGALAGLAAALLMAVSPAGIEASTFIWNPNPIAFASAIAFAAALHARLSGHARWWILAGVGAMVVMQCHVLGVVVVPPLVAAWLLDLRRRRRHRRPVRPLVLAGVIAALIVAAGYLPLAAYEVGNDFAETRAILAYLGGQGSAAASGVLSRILFVGLRALAWPGAGVVTDRPVLAALAAIAAVGLGAVAVLVGRPRSRRSATWVAISAGWSILALAVAAPSLAVVTPGLPNDHYHSFLDPLVLALAGAGLARLAAAGTRETRITAAAVGIALTVISFLAWPPAVAPDGGWRLAETAAARTRLSVGDAAFVLDGIPPFKSADALRFPLERGGARPLAADALAGGAETPSALVLVCDPLFADVVGAPCGGPAEDVWSAQHEVFGTLRDRFDAGSRRVISVYVLP